jgi:hypothetical protein
MRCTAYDAESFMWYLIWTTQQFLEERTGRLFDPDLREWDILIGNISPNAKLAYLLAAKLSATEWHSYSKPVSRAMRDHFRLLIPTYEEDGAPTEHELVYLPCYNGIAKLDTVYNDWFNPRKDPTSKDAAAEKLQQRSLVDNNLWSMLTRATYGIQTDPYAT